MNFFEKSRELREKATKLPWTKPGITSPYISDHKIHPIMDEEYLVKSSTAQIIADMEYIVWSANNFPIVLELLEETLSMLDGCRGVTTWAHNHDDRLKEIRTELEELK